MTGTAGGAADPAATGDKLAADSAATGEGAAAGSTVAGSAVAGSAVAGDIRVGDDHATVDRAGVDRAGDEELPILRYRLLPGSAGGVGGCLLVSAAAVPMAARTVRLASAVPRESGRLSIVMTGATSALMPELARWLRRWVPDRWDTVRLVAGRSGAPQPNGPPAGQELAECLGVEVLAPEGDVVVVPGGSLFVMDPVSANVRSGWVRFRPMRAPKPAGRRVPTPDWEPAVAGFGDSGVANLTVAEIPAGLWAHPTGPPVPPRVAVRRGGAAVCTAAILGSERASGPPGGPLDLAFAIPARPDLVALLVSRPGMPGLAPAALGQLLAALPDPLRERLVVLPYGDHPVVGGHLGAVVSRAANRTIRVGNGLPLYLPGHGRQIVAIGGDGAPTWRPFARDLVWRPQGGARIVRWTVPVDHLLPVAHGQLAIDERWIVEVIESGLWIRDRDPSGMDWLVRELPLDARYCNVVVGAPSAGQVTPPWRAIARLLRHLPPDARRRARVLVPWGAGDWVVRAAKRSCARGLDRAAVWLLWPDGVVRPRHGR